MKSLISSWRSGRRHQTPLDLHRELTLLIQPEPLVAPARRLNGQKTPSLPCRLFSEHLDVSPGHLQVLALDDSPPHSLSSPVSPLPGSAVVSDLLLLFVILMPQCYSKIQRSNMCTAHYCAAFNYIWMY